MAKLSIDPFYNLLEHIRPYSQRTPALLEQMREDSGQQAAYYAAFILICLQASTEMVHNKPLTEFTSTDFYDFAFFEVARNNERALALFEALLHAYQSDRVAVAG